VDARWWAAPTGQPRVEGPRLAARSEVERQAGGVPGAAPAGRIGMHNVVLCSPPPKRRDAQNRTLCIGLFRAGAVTGAPPAGAERSEGAAGLGPEHSFFPVGAAYQRAST